MKAQLECIGFSYHSSHMLIIVCTVGATAIHSSRPERTVCMLQTFKSSGWALRSYSQLVLKRVVKEQYGLELQTGWSFHSVRPAATWCWLELILMSASAYMTKTLFFTPNKLNLSFPKTKLFWNLMKEFFFFFTQTSQYFWFDGCYVVINGILCEHKTVAISWTEEVCGLTWGNIMEFLLQINWALYITLIYSSLVYEEL